MKICFMSFVELNTAIVALAVHLLGLVITCGIMFEMTMWSLDKIILAILVSAQPPVLMSSGPWKPSMALPETEPLASHSLTIES